MPWAVLHLWPSGASFLKFLSSLVIARLARQEWDGNFLHIREGMTQGDPLAIFAYGIGILSLIKKLKAGFPDANQTWYSNDSSSVGIFSNVELYFNSLKRLGLGHGYYPEPSKRVLIVHPHNIKYKKMFGLRNGFKVCTDLRYLGGFIGDNESKHDWLDERTNIWEQNVTKIRKTMVKYTCKI